MRITVLAHGTRGDVYPLTALAAELARRGHQVRVGASPNLVDAGRRLGLDTVPIAWDTKRALESAHGKAWIGSADFSSWIREAFEVSKEHDERLDEEVIDVCADSEAIVSGVMLEWRAALLAKARGIPFIRQDIFPSNANDVVPHPLLTTDPQPDAAATRATYRLYSRTNWVYLSDPVARFRRRLKPLTVPTPRMRPSRPLALQTYSPTLVPGLKWDDSCPFVSDLRMSRSDLDRLGISAMDTEMAQWLKSDDPPAFFDFGSTHLSEPAQMLAVIGRVCRSLGLRGLVVTGMDLSDRSLSAAAGPGVRLMSFADFDALLPRCTLAVHHGGATITAAGVRAGIPAMVCSVSYDQPFWGTQVERLGAGTHVRQVQVTEDVLRSGIRHIMREPVRRRAAHLGEQMRAEPDGTPTAADEIDRYLGVS